MTTVSPDTSYAPGSNITLVSYYPLYTSYANIYACTNNISVSRVTFSAPGSEQVIDATSSGTLAMMGAFNHTIPASGITSVTASISGFYDYAVPAPRTPLWYSNSFFFSNTHTKDPNAVAPPMVNIKFQ